MNRRQFLTGVGSLAAGLTSLRADAEGLSEDVGKIHKTAPPCGGYCPACDEVALGQCHGCGCDCGHCHGRSTANECKIYRCAVKRKVEHCGLCRDFPCMELIGLCYDPVWVSHRSMIELLRHRAKVGTEKWIEEQKAYWTPERKRAAHFVLAECKEKQRKLDSTG